VGPYAAVLAGWKRRNQAAFDAWQRLTFTGAAATVAGAWAFSEATVSPVMPDFLLVAVAAANHRPWRVLRAAIAGMIGGGLLTVCSGYLFPHQSMAVLGSLPLVTGNEVGIAEHQLANHGPAAFLFQPFSGVSFKIWAIASGQMRFSPLLVIPLFVVARSLRMIVLTLLARGISHPLRRHLRDNALIVAVAYVEVFTLGLSRLTQ
jgi:membrane protein YqaA with SNARE-associated domain